MSGPSSVRADEGFRRFFGGEPDGVWLAPGRVNLIGEHTDYNDGFALPFALAQTTAVAVRRSRHPHSRVWSEVDGVVVTLDGVRGGWFDYVAGIVWVLREAGFEAPSLDLAIASDVPAGSGLSSSAALECAVLTAFCDLGQLDLPVSARPAMAQRAENEYVGVPCGIMDQTASVLARPGHALHVDCRTLQTTDVPLDATILVINTNAGHSHVDNEYAERRRVCHEAARTIGVAALRDARLADLDPIVDEVAYRRARHVVTENQRVTETVAALDANDLATVGALMTASHRSMRDDFEITVAEIDLAVETALAAGALGARMTGGGFGGCVLALIEPTQTDHVSAAVADAFATAGIRAPDSFVARPSAGARRS